jgi:dipeptidyl aminopeptidase/acylaminoacyl peptidase
MMRSILYCLLFFISFDGVAQEKNKNWIEIIQQARQAGKYICLYVNDKDDAAVVEQIFADTAIASLLKKNYIVSQLSPRENKQADQLMQELKINTIPAILFFNKEGKLIFQFNDKPDLQLMMIRLQFISDPANHAFIKHFIAYQLGQHKPEVLLNLSYAASERVGDEYLSKKLAREYKSSWLDKITDTQLFTSTNIKFVLDKGLYAQLNEQDRIFIKAYQNPAFTDSLNQPGTAQEIIQSVIDRHIIQPKLFFNNKPVTRKPNWASIQHDVKKKYPKVNTNALFANIKIGFYRTIVDWPAYTELRSEQINQIIAEKKFISPFFGLNGSAWDVFLHCNDSTSLRRALAWSELSIKLEKPADAIQLWDTKASILYKLGRKDEAIAAEHQAVELARQYAPRNDKGEPFFVPEYLEVIKKMEAGEKFWEESTADQQKPVIDTNAIESWESVSDPAISDDGNYAGYVTTQNYVYHRSLHLKSIQNNWELKMPEVSEFQFMANNKSVVVLGNNNHLTIVWLGSSKKETLQNVVKYSVFKQHKNEFIIYHTTKNKLIVRDLNHVIKEIDSVISYQLTSNGAAVLFDKGNIQELSFYDFKSNILTAIGKYKRIEDLITAHDIAFSALPLNGKIAEKLIYVFRTKSLKLSALSLADLNDNLLRKYHLGNLQKFSKDNQLLFIGLIKKDPQIRTDSTCVQIWGYRDKRLISERKKTALKTSFSACIDINNGTIHQLDNETTSASVFDNNRLVLTESFVSNYVERNWNPASWPVYTVYHIGQTDTVRTAFAFHPFSVSPDGEYIIGTDTSNNLISVNVFTGHRVTLTDSLKKRSMESNSRLAQYDREFFLFAGWSGAHSLFFYDRYDIWEINPENTHSLTNRTAGYGRQNNISFQFGNNPDNAIFKGNNILLTAFDHNSKQNGFYYLENNRAPKRIIMDDYFFNHRSFVTIGANYPLKAKNANCWIVCRQRSNISPNYFITANFNQFTPLSNSYPEKKYNWLNTKIINYFSLNGTGNQTIMYTPQNFDSTKKYPVIIHYYDKKTDNLNAYLRPELSGDAINIPWFVSHGYIVCTPDIHYQKGETGQSAVNAIVGLGNYLKKLSYIDSNKLGLCGHSFAGYQTNYIITQSNMFAAAHASSGFCDLVSSVNSILYNEGCNYFSEWAELMQGRLEKTLWQDPEMYFKNSPIMYANKVQTPLLMMNNEKDGIVNFSQGLEYFLALRRLGKKVWMLQYKNGYHSLIEQKDAADYTRRIEQFFGHYLKGEPMPDWMSYPDR